MLVAKKIIGGSWHAREIRAFIKRAACIDFPVLLLGETGVGKEVIVGNIHYMSRRQKGPLIPINCSCISTGLAETELFGHHKGSFTDCKEDRAGLIEAAEGGTVFFDEVAELPSDLQPKLLRVLEDKEVRRIGEAYTRPVDVRFIFATNKDLNKEVRSGRFRKDLLYRLNTLPFRVLPLRERQEDLPMFIEEILKELNTEYQAIKRMNSETLDLLINYRFPGNIRELENIIRRAYTVSEDRGGIMPEDIFALEEMEEEEIPEKLYRKMIVEAESFWEVIHKPFIKRDLNRNEVREVISKGLRQAGGSYIKLMNLFKAGRSVKDYKKFMSVLSCHRLKIEHRRDIIEQVQDY